MNKQKTVRVLIVEDDAMVAEMIRGMLEDMKYTIVGEAADGLEAVEMVQSLQPDIILIDIEMPHLDGLKATQRIQECRPTPVVVVTAHESPELVKQASQVGVGAYLVKPPGMREIERAITIAMARFEDMLELRRLNAELQDALARVKLLSGFLPICASCKKIRDDQGYWQQIEGYLENHSEAEFSHGICPDCAAKIYPDYV